MGRKVAHAYAPSTITNFFAVHRSLDRFQDVAHSGATGGGFIVSRGVVTTASVESEKARSSIEVVVDENPDYGARTTRNAVQLLLERTRSRDVKVRLRQRMQVPVGQGFGASAASAISAVYATAAALELDLSKEELAAFAHEAEILQQTGLGTVSAAYDAVGAGAIVEPGGPGVAKFMNVKISSDIRIVTGSLAPYAKSDLLGSGDAVARVNRFGTEALSRVIADPTLECLASSGEWFADKLGLMRPEVRELVSAAKRAGASYASQNMVGHAMHAVVPRENVDAVVESLTVPGWKPRVDVLEIGSTKAGVIESGESG